MNVKRALWAFFIAPLLVPLLLMALALFDEFQTPNHFKWGWVFLVMLISAVSAYGGVVLLGVPAFLLLNSMGMKAFWWAPVTGFIIGAVTSVIGMSIFVWSQGKPVHDIATAIAIGDCWITGAIGALVGATLWLIARPDKP